MIIGYKEWMKDPAKAIEKWSRYNKNSFSFEKWKAQYDSSPELRARVAKLLREQGYEVNESGEWVKRDETDAPKS